MNDADDPIDLEDSLRLPRRSFIPFAAAGYVALDVVLLLSSGGGWGALNVAFLSGPLLHVVAAIAFCVASWSTKREPVGGVATELGIIVAMALPSAIITSIVAFVFAVASGGC